MFPGSRSKKIEEDVGGNNIKTHDYSKNVCKNIHAKRTNLLLQLELGPHQEFS